MDVITSTQLPLQKINFFGIYSIIVSPRKYPAVLIDNAHVPTAKAHFSDFSLRKSCFHPWFFRAALEEWTKSLNSSDNSWQLLIVLDESIGSPCTEGPAPEYHAIVGTFGVSKDRKVLRVIRIQTSNGEVL